VIPAALSSGPASPPERLAGLIEGLCKAVAAHGPRGLLTLPLLLLLWSRLRRMAVRARRLASRIAAAAPLSRHRPRAARQKPSRLYIRLPRGITWLVRVVPGTASGAATLQFLLDDPEMAELAQLPPMRRLLRPLCRMLGVRPPPVAKKPAPAEPAQPVQGAGEPRHPPPQPRLADAPALGPPAPPPPTLSKAAI
jgi:hypothetical protein